MAPQDRKVPVPAGSLSDPQGAKTEHGRRNNHVARHEATGVCRRSRAQLGGRRQGAQGGNKTTAT